MDNKAQIEGFDIVISVFIFLLLFAFAGLFWQDIFFSAANARELEKIKLKATELADQLVLSPGGTGNWHKISDYNKIGLAVKPRIISRDRLQALQNADYNSLKAKLNIEGNEYLVQLVKDQNIVFSKGIAPTGIDSVKVERIVVYENEAALLSVIIHG